MSIIDYPGPIKLLVDLPYYRQPAPGRERRIMSLWDENKIKKLQIAAIRCDFTSEDGLKDCGAKATYTLEGRYICTDCLIGKLMLEIYTLKHYPNQDL